MKWTLRIVYSALSVIFLFYLALADPDFPEPPSDSLQSDEPADIETPTRRGYYTNLNREEVMEHYKREYSLFPTYRLNYPPEESQTIIRDQTRNTYLEEIVHPMRESLFIAGNVTTRPEDEIWRLGRKFTQKIIVKQVNSDVGTRLIVGALTIVLIGLVWRRINGFIDNNN